MRCLPRFAPAALPFFVFGVGCAPASAPPAAPPAVSSVPAAVSQDQAGAAAVSLDAMRKRLASSSDSRDRVLTIDEIAMLGQNAKPALDELVKATADPELRVRWHAARAIGLVGEDAVTALPVLVGLLDDPDPIVATQAAAAIGAIRRDESTGTISASDATAYDSARAALAKSIVHPDPRVRRASIRALAVLEASPEALAPILAKQLADADPSVVLPSLHSLADMDDDAVPVLLEALKDPTSRYWACLALAEIGPGAAAAAAPLAELASTGGIEERLQAILALASIGEKAEASVPALVRILDSGDPSLEFAAAFALGRVRSREADAVLEKTAADADPVLAATASWARARIHPDDAALRAEALSRLRAQLNSPVPHIREGVASALSDLAPILDDAGKGQLATDFTNLLADADHDVGVAAGAALIRLGPAALAALKPRLADAKVRLNVMEILAEMGEAAKPLAGELIAALDDPDADCRGDAAVALAAIGPAASAAVPRLQKLLDDQASPEGVRYAAAYALGRIGAAAKPALDRLRGLAASPDEVLATVAVWAALKIAPEDRSLVDVAIPLLRRALRGNLENARLEAAVALGDIGPAARSAIPLLELVAEEDASKSVREAAAHALGRIRVN